MDRAVRVQVVHFNHTLLNAMNPQVQSQLNELADMCCQTLIGDGPMNDTRADALLKALVMSGYARQNENTLQVDIEHRIKDHCGDQIRNRGGAMTGILSRLQSKFDDLVRWETNLPKDKTSAKPANISSANES